MFYGAHGGIHRAATIEQISRKCTYFIFALTQLTSVREFYMKKKVSFQSEDKVIQPGTQC